MSKYNVHAGHCPQGLGAYGAVGILQESVEDRKVKNRVISALKKEGHTVYDCTCDQKTTKNGCLKKIVAKCNAHSVDLDISIHLNSGRNDRKGDGSTGGVEVFCYSSKTSKIAASICSNISKSLGIRNRGVKYSNSLYVLNNTKSPAILIECCFVDDADDAKVWDANKCGDAIASAIVGKKVQGSSSSSSKPSKPSTSKPSSSKKEPALGRGDKGSDVKELQKKLIACGYSCGKYGADGTFGKDTEKAVKAFQKYYGLSVDGLAGKKTIAKLDDVYDGKSSTTSTKGNWVARLQAECNKQGFSKQKVDGIAGRNTLKGCPVLHEGSTGKITKLVQERLIDFGYSCGSSGADGVNGAGTQKAIKKFQKDKKLAADGIVGNKTWKKLLKM